jgi:hypothetical protein
MRPLIAFIAAVIAFAVPLPQMNVSQPQSVNVTQFSGTAASMNTGASDGGTQRVTQAAGGNPCMNPASTLSSKAGATSGTSATQIIALSSGQSIFICSANITGVSGTSPTFSLVYGTATNCASGQTTFLGAWTTTANAVYPFVSPQFVVPASNAVCFKDGGTSPVQNYSITYVQQ